MSDRAYLAVLRHGCVLQKHTVYAATPRSPSVARWWLPGGGLLPGESFAEGAAREAREEIGCAVILGPVLEVMEFLETETGVRSVHLVFSAQLASDDEPIVPSDQPEDPGSGRVTELRWLPVNDWPEAPQWLRAAVRGELQCAYVVRRV
ncbi:MAG: NUDIX domain-containing protein [Chloroflexota bacterium]